MKIKIFNNNTTAEISFQEETTFKRMIEMIENCIKSPDINPIIRYIEGDKLIAIYPAVWLQNSIIKIEE